MRWSKIPRPAAQRNKNYFFNSISYLRGRISRWWAATGLQSRICSGGFEPNDRPAGGRWVVKRGPSDPRGARVRWGQERTRAGGGWAWKDTLLCWRLARPACAGCYCAPISQTERKDGIRTTCESEWAERCEKLWHVYYSLWVRRRGNIKLTRKINDTFFSLLNHNCIWHNAELSRNVNENKSTQCGS